jgi:hypothetical protein
MSARDEAVSTRASGEWPGGKVSRASPVQACRGNRHGDRIPVLVMYAADAHHQSTQGEIPQDIGLLTALAQRCKRRLIPWVPRDLRPCSYWSDAGLMASFQDTCRYNGPVFSKWLSRCGHQQTLLCWHTRRACFVCVKQIPVTWVCQ